MKNKKLLLGIGVLALVLAAGFLVSGRSIQGSVRNRNTGAPANVGTLQFLPSSPIMASGIIMAGAQNAGTPVTVARYRVRATNEAIKITQLTLVNDLQHNSLVNNAAISSVILYYPNSLTTPNVLSGTATATLNSDGWATFYPTNFWVPANYNMYFEARVVTNSLGQVSVYNEEIGDYEEQTVAIDDQIELDFSTQPFVGLGQRSNRSITGTVSGGLDGPEFTLTTPAPPPAPTVDLQVNGEEGPVTVITNSGGASVTLSWSSTNAVSCTASPSPLPLNAWLGDKTTNGTQEIYNLSTIVETFTLTCANSAGNTVSDAVTVEVIPPPAPTVDLKANGVDGPLSTNRGDPVTLSWTSSNAITCTFSTSMVGIPNSTATIPNKPINGSLPTTNPTNSMSFSMNCTDSAGNVSNIDTVDVNVSSPPPASTGNYASGNPTVNLLANGSNGPLSINSGDNVTLSWTSTNATSCAFNISGQPTISRPANDSLVMPNQTASQTFLLNCTSPGGTGSDSVQVNITPTGTGNYATGSGQYSAPGTGNYAGN